MRARRVLPALLLLPALAMAQGKAAQDKGAQQLPASTGRYLHAALPARVDLMVHTPDLPALLASAPADGLGAAKAWRAAFRKQMEAWGERTGAPEVLREGAESMLAAADGEALLASLALPPIEGPERATLLAFRTTRKRAVLATAFQQLVDGGLIVRYPGPPRDEEVGGRPVLGLSDVSDRLYVLLQDGLVAASDHPLALGLLFRGLERSPEPQPAGDMLLEVRHGRGDAAWTGWTYGARESVSWQTTAPAAVRAPLAYGIEPLAAVALPRAMDAPVLPVAAPSWLAGTPAGGPPERLVLLSRGGRFHVMGGGASVDVGVSDEGISTIRIDDVWVSANGEITLDSELPKPEKTRVVAGAATRLGWLRGWAGGRLPLPVPGIDRELLLGPLTSAAEASEGKEPLVTWTAPDRPGELRGPRWHGPTTMLALRTIADIVAKRGPEAKRSAHADDALPVRTGGAALPPPRPPRTGGDDAE